MQAERIDALIPFPQGAPRSRGVHVSSLIRSKASDIGLLDPRWVEDLKLIEVEGSGEKWWNRLDQVSRIRMGMGLAWEQWYLPQVQGVVHQPGEMEVDGIFMTHDGESLDVIMTERGFKHTIAIHEVKLTYKSCNTVGDLGTVRRGKDPNWMWLMQTKAYCKGRDSRLAFLHILYVCGDYSYPISPRLDVWRIEYTQQEIDDAWEVLAEHLREARAEGSGGL